MFIIRNFLSLCLLFQAINTLYLNFEKYQSQNQTDYVNSTDYVEEKSSSISETNATDFETYNTTQLDILNSSLTTESSIPILCHITPKTNDSTSSNKSSNDLNRTTSTLNSTSESYLISTNVTIEPKDIILPANNSDTFKNQSSSDNLNPSSSTESPILDCHLPSKTNDSTNVINKNSSIANTNETNAIELRPSSTTSNYSYLDATIEPKGEIWPANNSDTFKNQSSSDNLNPSSSTESPILDCHLPSKTNDSTNVINKNSSIVTIEPKGEIWPANNTDTYTNQSSTAVDILLNNESTSTTTEKNQFEVSSNNSISLNSTQVMEINTTESIFVNFTSNDNMILNSTNAVWERYQKLNITNSYERNSTSKTFTFREKVKGFFGKLSVFKKLFFKYF